MNRPLQSPRMVNKTEDTIPQTDNLTEVEVRPDHLEAQGSPQHNGTETRVRPNGTARVQSQINDIPAPAMDETNWKEKAIRLQAEMDNFRKRQTRRADEAISAERDRLLMVFLPAVDNLARALTHQEHRNGDDSNSVLRQGVELTHRELLRLLEAEGVTLLKTVDHEFDPEWHEAIAMISANVESGTVVEEVEAGYKLGDKLLRPAKVVVAA